MEQEVILHRLLYINEHLSCGNYLSDINIGFLYIEPTERIIIERESVSRNYLFLVTKGEISITCNLFENRVISQGEMILISRSSKFRWEANTSSAILILGFDIPQNPCDKLNFQSLYNLRDEIEYDFQPIPIRHPITAFNDLLIYLLKNGMNCSHLHLLKQQELFLLLRGFYSKEELATLFYPIIGRDVDFKEFVLKNFQNVNNINGLIELSCMSKSSFFTKFKETFGITAKQWLLKQKEQIIVYESSKPGNAIKDIMAACGFDSPAMFNQFCKHHFHCTPKELIQKYRTSNQ